MKFISTRGKSPAVGLREAVVSGTAPDGGLYMPVRIPRLEPSFFSQLPSMSLPEISCRVAQAFLGEEADSSQLEAAVRRAIDFEAPLIPIRAGSSSARGPRIWALELFHGPSLAFKDFGARFMASLMSLWTIERGQELTILAATSGDTGSAVAMGFFEMPGVRVVILYPRGKVSRLQELQMSTLGGNILALEVDGVFDDCQRMAKEAFRDRELSLRLRLGSANSINVARLLPQTFYYFHARSRVDPDRPLAISVPSGNLGNLTAGLIAKRMGLPVEVFVAACNSNRAVSRYLETGEFVPQPSLATLSNAMDVGDPSNLERMQSLYQSDVRALSQDLLAFAFDDRETMGAIARLHREGYLLDPHGAVGLLGLEAALDRLGEGFQGVFLETAHPAKFREVVEEAVGRTIEIPPGLREVLSGEKKSVPIRSCFADLKQLLLERFS